eukprot:jgi/Chrzof1/13472/UNPLg00557.t1
MEAQGDHQSLESMLVDHGKPPPMVEIVMGLLDYNPKKRMHVADALERLRRHCLPGAQKRPSVVEPKAVNFAAPGLHAEGNGEIVARSQILQRLQPR